MNDVRAAVAAAGGPELLERLEKLEQLRAPRIRKALTAPDRDATPDTDIVIAGGGLWSLLAPLLASAGLRVIVVERGTAGVAHREWNASRKELSALVDCGLVDDAKLDDLILARYRTGTCRFHGGGTYPVDGVLDCAIDAGRLLAHARRAGEAAGVTYLDRHEIVAESSGPTSIAIDAGQIITAKILVDARGAASPYASADLVCPTVGGVLEGLDMDPEVGEILATVDPVDGGRQHVWEGFPGRRGENTVYLFYYARADEPASLLTLYSRFFATLPTYKSGATRLLRPTFGFIPGWSRLTRAPAPPSGRIVLVGDAAARQSPLTYCGFGTTLRSLAPAVALLRAWVDRPGAVPPHAMKDAPVHAMTGALAHMLASRRFTGNELNELLDASFHSLHAMGPEAYAELLRDELSPRELVGFLRRTAQRHPAVWGQVRKGLGLGQLGRWSVEALRALTAA